MKVFEGDFFGDVLLAVKGWSHSIVKGGNGVDHLFIVGPDAVSQKGIVADSLCLVSTDEIAENGGQFIGFLLRQELSGIDAFRQKTDLLKTIATLADIESLS